MSTTSCIFTFSISTLPPEGAFQMLYHFHHLWPLGQKSVIQIFDRWSGYKKMKQNMQRGLILSALASCICSILQLLNLTLMRVYGTFEENSHHNCIRASRIVDSLFSLLTH